MMKLFTRPAIALMAALCLCACNKMEEPVEEPAGEQNGTAALAGTGWTVSIPATMGADTKALAEDPDTHKLIATFEKTDNIYVYNKTKETGYDNVQLHPDRDGASANLTGTLEGDYSEGDVLVLCYTHGRYGYYTYYDQLCNSLDGVMDCAEATVTITAADASSKTLTTGNASFENLQSIFQLSFTDGTAPVPVKAVYMDTENGWLVNDWGGNGWYNPNYGYIRGDLPDGMSPTTDPVYLAFRNESTEADIYHFRVYDGSDVWLGDKAAPAGKIVIGKYYTLSAPIPVTIVPKPTVTIYPDDEILEPDDPLSFSYRLSLAPTTISGTGERYFFAYTNTSNYQLMVTLNNAHLSGMEENAITSYIGDLAITLQGDNSISAGADLAAFRARYYNSFSTSLLGIYNEGNVVFSGNGTLIITASSDNPDTSGECLYSNGILVGSEGTVRAAYGYTLSVSDGVINGDGTTTWVYAVAPNPNPAEGTLTICDGTEENMFVPYSGSYADKYLKSEFLIPDAMIEEMSGSAIKSMKFYLKDPADQVFNGYCQVFLKVVSNNPYANRTTSLAKQFIGKEDATIVHRGALNVSGNEMTITFSEPFRYTVGNLLVGIYQIEPGSSTKKTVFYGETVDKSCLQASHNSNVNSISIGTQYNFIPKTTFTYGPVE